MSQDQTTHSIAELSAEFSVTARAIRFYEDQGLLHPERQGQKRIFSATDRARLAWILRGSGGDDFHTRDHLVTGQHLSILRAISYQYHLPAVDLSGWLPPVGNPVPTAGDE